MSASERPRAILTHLDLPVAFTLVGLVFAFLCLVFAMSGQLLLALVMLAMAGLVDFFDGWVARKCHPGGVRTTLSSRLDAVVDVCSFGMAPAALGVAFGLDGPLEVAVLALYLSANALRLAYFSTVSHGVIEGKRFYLGMPVTYVALALPWAYLGTFVWPRAVMEPVLLAIYGILAALMVSSLRFMKPGGIWYGILTAIGLVPVGVYLWALTAGRAPWA